MIERGEFVEWAEVHGNLYGTSRAAIEEPITGGQDVLLEIDWQGALQIKRLFPNAVLIFILPPSYDELLLRLHAEGKVLAPGAFLPAAERHGVIGEIDRWVVTQAAALAAGFPIETADGGTLRLDVGSLCVHGDTPGAAEVARAVRRALEDAGTAIGPFT